MLLLVVLAGLKDAVTPEGNADAANATLPVKPFCATTEIAVLPLLPGAMESAA